MQSEADRQRDERAYAEAMAKRARERAESEQTWLGKQLVGLGLTTDAVVALVEWKADHHLVKRWIGGGATEGQVLRLLCPDGASLPHPEIRGVDVEAAIMTGAGRR